MNVVITGGAGFLGSHLADAYLRDGDCVTVIDNYVTSDGSNIGHLLEHQHFHFVQADICVEFPALPEKPDLILHFASPASPIDYAQIPLETLAVNGPGTQRCCKAALAYGARVLFASTSEIYGDPLEHPQRETYWGNVNSVGERSCYDEGKRFGEAVMAAYRRAHGLDARMVRIFNTYGPRMRANDGRVVPTFIAQALDGAALTVFGDGTQTRSLCYVDDLIEGIRRFAALPNPAHFVVNLGAEHEVTVLEIAQRIARACNVDLRVEHRPLPPDDPTRRRPDLSRARELLGWEPRTPLEIGLQHTIDWFRSKRRSLTCL